MQTYVKFPPRAWIKRPESKLNAVRLLQYGLYPFPILRPTFGTGDLSQEAERLKELRAAGICVPKVLSSSSDRLVTEDVGPNLEVLTKEEPERRDFYIHSAMAALLLLHQHGFVHGRPFLRDLTFLEGQVYFLDLEESVRGTMPLSTAQIRDLFLFAFSLKRLGYGKVDTVLAYYLQNRSVRFREGVARQLRLLKVLSSPISLIPERMQGKDLRTVRGVLADISRALASSSGQSEATAKPERRFPFSLLLWLSAALPRPAFIRRNNRLAQKKDRVDS